MKNRTVQVELTEWVDHKTKVNALNLGKSNAALLVHNEEINLVGKAVLEIDKKADVANTEVIKTKEIIGNLGTLGTVEKSNIVAAVNEVSSSLDNVKVDLQTKPSYPTLEGEIGVVNVQYEYGDVKRYGAVKLTRNEKIDDSPFFQNAIDSAFALGFQVKVTRGIYTIKNSLLLPKQIQILGLANKVSYRGQVDGTVIETYCLEVFKPKTGVVCNLTINNLYFYNRGSEYSILFSGFDFLNTFITKNNFHCYSVVMLSGIGGGQSRFSDNDIQSINKSCFCKSADSRSGIKTQAPTGIIDSLIDNNYINGNPLCNPIAFDCRDGYPMASSKIQNNYIDFLKYAFVSPRENLFNNNIIDHCFRGFAGAISGAVITNNHFLKISKRFIDRFQNADKQMQEQDWTCISSSNEDFELGNYGFRVLVSDNLANNCDIFFNSDGYLKSGMKILNQVYVETNTKVKNFITNVGWDSSITDNLDNVMIEPLMYIKYDKLPNPKLTGRVVNTFNSHKIIYQNKELTNIDGTWYDSMGNEVVYTPTLIYAKDYKIGEKIKCIAYGDVKVIEKKGEKYFEDYEDKTFKSLDDYYLIK